MKTEFEFPVIELVDRYTIARVKFEKTNGRNGAELDFYLRQVARLPINQIQQELDGLEEIHRQIWALEDDFKKCRMDNVPLEGIGRRALEIRDINNRRVEFKNAIAEKLNDLVREIKQDHVSDNDIRLH
jgi:hypothetical protein